MSAVLCRENPECAAEPQKVGEGKGREWCGALAASKSCYLVPNFEEMIPMSEQSTAILSAHVLGPGAGKQSRRHEMSAVFPAVGIDLLSRAIWCV